MEQQETIPVQKTRHSQHDGYGIMPIEDMTERQLLEETVYWLREAGKTIAMIQGQGIGGMMKAMMNRKG